MIPLQGNDIDTDRIIPARYMTGITFDGLGEHAFHDERFDRFGKEKQHPYNDPRFKGHSILVVGKNFGCGSSREHAPQALMRSGITALVGESFADIFAGNCTSLGIPFAVLKQTDIEELAAACIKNPDCEACIDVEAQEVVCGSRRFSATLPESSRSAFISGLWDMTGVLLANKESVLTKAAELPYFNHFSKFAKVV